MSKCYASAVLAIAAAEIGYHEKKSNSQLGNPTANAGSANYTKYARDFDEKYPKWYNGKKNGFAWCDMFVDWCMLTAFGYADALRLLCQPERSAGAGCTYSLMYYEKQGRYHAKDPKPGDQIFFSTAHSKSNVSHTGLVEKVDGSKVYTIEGNTSDQVARRSYYLSNSYIVGYGRPAYDAEPGNANADSQTPSNGTTSEVTYTVVAGDTLSKIATKYGTTYQKLAAHNGITNPNIIRVGQKIKIPGTASLKKTNAEIAKEVIAGKWGNGTDRKKRLEAAGYDYNAVQRAVNADSQTPSNGTTSEVTYTVVAGDTLSKIATKYGTTYQKLAAHNGITNPNIIRVGQKIKIPGTASLKKTNAEIAKEVIAGKWGNGTDRKKRLEAAGYDYNAVQRAVNAALAH